MFRFFVLCFFISNLFAETLIFTNQDEQGNLLPLSKESPLALDRPISSKIENLKQKIRKIKGNKFRIQVQGVLIAKRSEMSSASLVRVPLDLYENGDWVETKDVEGNWFVLQIKIKDHDTISTNDTILEGFQKVALPFNTSSNYLARFRIYKGKFKFQYDIPISEIQKHLGLGDTPKLYVEVVMPERLGSTKEETKKEKIDLNVSPEFDGIEK